MSEIKYSNEQRANDSNFKILPSDVETDVKENLQTSSFINSEDSPRSSEELSAKKRKRILEKYELKSKRLKPFLNHDYRNILNLEIQQISARVSQDDLYAFQESQIGSSIWTVMEKSLFFAALDSLGKDNIRGISVRVGSKSELEVKEYLLVLEEKTRSMVSYSSDLCTLVEIPAASEISDNCCALIEKAADALAAHEEYKEAKIEEQKWDDLWIITQNYTIEFGRRRNRFKHLKSMKELKPILDLFILRNWFLLTENIFMNSSISEENWQTFAEPHERPAFRATALEDFYSLAISVTKRLVSATIFCTMSRLRARGTIDSKLTEVNLDDAKAAIRTLGSKSNSDKFWTHCARRCKLSVVDEKENCMTYDEVESVMTSHVPQCSESNYDNIVLPSHDPEFFNPALTIDREQFSDHQIFDSDLVISSDEMSDELNKISSVGKEEIFNQTAEKQKQAAEEVEDIEVETIDMRSSHAEEQNLMRILKVVPTYGCDDEKLLTAGQSTSKFTRDIGQRSDNWREKLEYYSEWETLDTQIHNKSFASNRAQTLVVTNQKVSPKLVSQLKNDLNNVTIGSNEYYNKPESDLLHSNHSGPALESDNDETNTVSSISFDETIAQLRGLAANFQPSSGDEFEDYMVETGSP
ncbi:hypothetical protein HI914_07111 [Erysiphe necator]|nr:hypothetical protein HI914_07111 [Erysiphe necator]